MDNEGDSDLFSPAPETSRSVLALFLKRHLTDRECLESD